MKINHYLLTLLVINTDRKKTFPDQSGRRSLRLISLTGVSEFFGLVVCEGILVVLCAKRWYYSIINDVLYD